MNSLLTIIGNRKNPLLFRWIVLMFIYSVSLFISFYLSYEFRFDFNIPEDHRSDRLEILFWLVPLKLSLLFAFGQFSVLLSFFRLPDIYRILSALGVNAVLLYYLWYFFDGNGLPPRGVILTDFVFSAALIFSFRMSLRVIRERYMDSQLNKHKKILRVAIIGCGDTATALASELISKRGLGMQPVMYLDYELGKKNIEVHGIPVIDTPDNIKAVADRYNIDKAIVALPSESKSYVQDVIRLCREGDIPVEIVPSMNELASGKVRATQLRPVQFEDLLGRPPVKLDSKSISELITGNVVMVTGGGGSIGSELCRQIVTKNPRRLLIVDQSETQTFQIEQDLIKEGFGGIILPIVADVTDAARIDQILSFYSPQLIFHAAAYKHVPMMESQPGEALKNNSVGTAKLAQLASEHGVEEFVLISTDKAINPLNVMGATKRLAEIFIQALANDPNNKTNFMAVRFGNVLGSSGSVIPIFKKQIAEGGPVTVTHPDVSRYFMTIPEAVGLVLQCATIGKNGQILVLDMGTPIKIVDVAKQLIRISDLEPDIDIEIKFTGLRPGEKLFEELQHHGEEYAETEHPSIFTFRAEAKSFAEASKMIEEIESSVRTLSAAELKTLMKRYVSEYVPYLD